MKVSIFGLGYVGSVSVGCLTSLGHEVIGVDVSTMKAGMINAGKSPVIEKDLGELITEGVESGRIRSLTVKSLLFEQGNWSSKQGRKPIA